MASPKKAKSVPVSMSRRSDYGPRFQEVLKDGKYVLEPHPNQTPVQDIDFNIFSEELSRLGHSQDDIRDKFLFLFRDIESFGDRAATAELEIAAKVKRASQKLKKANEKLADLEEKIEEVEAAIPDEPQPSLNRQQRRAAKKLSVAKASSASNKLPTKKTVRPIVVNSADGLTTDPLKAAVIATEIASKIGSVLEPSLKAISDTMQQSVSVAFEIQKNAHGIQSSIEKIANSQEKLLNSNQRVFEAIKEIKLVPPEPTSLPAPVANQITESTKKGIDKSVWDEIIKNRTKPTVPGQPVPNQPNFQKLNGSQLYTDYSRMGPRSPLMGASLAASRHNPMPILAPKPLALSAESGLLSGLAGDLIGGMAGRYALAGAGVVGAGVIGTIAGSIVVPMLLEAAIGMLKDDAKTVTVPPTTEGQKPQVRSQKSLEREKFFDSVMESDDVDMVEMGFFGPALKVVPRKPDFTGEGGSESVPLSGSGNSIQTLIDEKTQQLEQLKLSGSNDLGTTRDILNTQAELEDLKSSLNKPVAEQNEILKSALIGPAQDKPYLEKLLDLFESLVYGAVSGGSMNKPGSSSVGSGSSASSSGTPPAVKSYAASSGLGSLSAQYESGSLGSAAIGNDSTGGYSYGKYQFSTKRGSFDNLMKGLQEKAPEAYAKLQAAGGSAAAAQGTPEFKAAWKEASSMPGFADAEHGVAKATLYDPALSRIEKSTGVDVSKRSKALQDVAWSVAIQHGDSGANSVFKSAQQKLGKDFANASDEEIMNSIYDVRGNFFSNSTDAERRSVQARFVKEREAALGSLQAERSMPSVPDVPLSSSFASTVPTVPEKSVADVAADQRATTQSVAPAAPINVVNNSTVAGGQSSPQVNLMARNQDNTVERLQNIYLYHGVVY